MDLTAIPTIKPASPAVSGPTIAQAVNDVLTAMAALPGQAITLLVNDPQRHTDSLAVMRELFERCDFAHRRVLVATGTHRFDEQARRQFEAKLLPAGRIDEIAWHDSTADNLAAVGHWACHPWLLDDSGHLLAIGSVEPHYFAGFTGAHKTCTIGCAARESIEANHANALSPTAQPGRLDGNDVHEGIAAMAYALQAHRPVFTINLVQDGHDVRGAYAAAPVESLKAAAELAAECFIQTIETPADALILEISGPLGVSFYQAEKGIKNNEWAVKDGGVLVLQASCPSGIGQDHFVSLLSQAQTYQQAVDVVNNRGYNLGDHKAVKLRYLTDPACRGVRVFAVSPGLSQQQADTLGISLAPSVTDALTTAAIDPAKHVVYRLENAGNLVVRPR